MPVDKPTADPLVGTTVAQYQITARLGGGGMGVVYAARDIRLGRRVALKFLPPPWSHDEGAKQRFIREAQAASATDHRNICTIHDISEGADGQLFIVMAHYDGPTLKQRLDAGPLRADEAIELAAQVAEGLAKAHAQGVVHRDIKPGNLILTEDGVKILDFGLAKFADARLKLTLEGSTIGTVAYMSPEQARGEDADARSDVWATGVVLYEMLSGDVPFKGGYPEAISHAIRHETPHPLRGRGDDVSEALEQLVFRALHKDPNIRFQTARDLARALRQLQGRTMPMDLRTEAVSVGAIDAAAPVPARPARLPRSLATRSGAAATVLVVALTVGVPVWVFYPVERVAVAVAPVVNQTGYAELEEYRLALTQELVAQLGASSSVRVLPYGQLLEVIRRFRDAGADVSSREALRAIAAHTGAERLVVPVIVYENGAWRARVELRDSETAISTPLHETPPVVSSLMKDALYGQMTVLAAGITAHFLENGPARAAAAASVHRALGRTGPPPPPTLRSLDAAAAFERGLDAYEQVDYAAARAAFAEATELDARHPLPLAWRSRVAGLLRQDAEAADAADRAAALPIDQLSLRDRLFVEAVIAEARRDRDAEARYRGLASQFPDEAAWMVELAGYYDRQGRTDDALAAYHAALAADLAAVRPHVELCRLYSPSRLNEPALAREQAESALKAYRALNNRAGEVQALWCLTDVLRAGSEAERREARRHAEAALEIVQNMGQPYSLARAWHYLGVVALLAERNGLEAATFFEKALGGTRDTGNAFLEARTLMNLGVAHELFGRHAAAVAYYRQSFELSERLGNEQEAAWSQINAAAILIDYGGDAAQAVRDAQNALVVFQQLGDKDFEVFARRVIAWHHRYRAEHAEALRELTLAQAAARERNLDTKVAQVTIDLARLRMDVGDYLEARRLLADALAAVTGTDAVHARIELARAHTRMGRFVEAAAELARASEQIETGGDIGSLPLLYASLGELAYESGDLGEARREFGRASALWTEELPEAASVEARAYLGLLDALEGNPARGRRAVSESLEQARRMGRVALEARCRIMLARLEIQAGRPSAALGALEALGTARVPALGPELRAQLHHWRSQALMRLDDPGAAADAAVETKHALDELKVLLPEPHWSGLMARTDVRVVSGT